MAAVQRTAQRAQTAVDQILDQVRASPVVHADETGWRQDGHNGYVWTCSTPTHRYFLRRNRSRAVVDEVLGDAASPLVCDFYAPTTITTAPYNAAGLTCCGISTTCDPSTPMMHHWPGGLTPSTRFTTGPRPLPIPRPGSGALPNWLWSNACWPSASPTSTTPQQPRPSCADASSATSRNSLSS